MPMIKCRECGNPISTQAPICPKCGMPNARVQKGGGGVSYVIIAIVVACVLFFVAVPSIGIIAAIAIPSFLAMEMRAKRSEAPVHLDGIRTALAATHAETQAYPELPPCPDGITGRNPQEWSGECAQIWSDAVGWAPDGPVRCQYQVILTGEPGSLTQGFEATAHCDIDGDGNECEYLATDSMKAQMVTMNNVY